MSQLEKQLLGQRKDEGSIPIELAHSINNECEKYECEKSIHKHLVDSFDLFKY